LSTCVTPPTASDSRTHCIKSFFLQIFVPTFVNPQKVRRLGFSGLGKKDQKFSKLRDEEWMSMFSYLIQIYEPTLKMDNKANLAGAQKQFVKCVLALPCPSPPT
jgi:hypothetical protein